MKLSDFDYNLPKELIAQKPIRPRDHSRLLVLDRKTGEIEHYKFYEIEEFLKKGDVLVLNNSKVIPARLLGKKKETGGKIEVLLLRKISPCIWKTLLGGKGRKEGLEIEFEGKLSGKIIKKLPQGIWHIKFNFKNRKFEKILDKIGEAPVPPYIKIKDQKSKVKNFYQTVYAKYKGSVAAPTAGFHFTERLMNRLKKKGVQFEYVTLHVGYGTFQPVKEEQIEKHKMHSEYFSITKEVVKRLNKAKKEKRRIIAVGTTSCRVLESALKPYNHKVILHGKTNLFIYPGYKFKFTDALITNFHLPKSTLLMLVSAFAGKNLIKKVYKEAIKKKYRFYSFGDAMMIK